ncbi:MAG: metallophosphoesterase [Verrucomicrobiales bacterium]|nr:metallophosphoesterase [Verrucomicrobiales bacterium]
MKTIPIRSISLTCALSTVILFLVALLSSGSRAESADPPKKKDLTKKAFSFVQMCDTQLGMGGYEHDVMTFNLAVKQINAMNPDFVVICGDLVQTANENSVADFNEIRAKFTLPCYCAPGNHDVGNEPTPESLKRYREKVGEDYYAVEHKGYTLVIANTQLWKAPVEGESEAHDAWFRKTLEAAGAKGSPVIVVVHYPLFLKTLDEKESYYNLPLEKRKEILALCEKNGVVAFLAGHTHKQITNEYKGIQLVNGETTSKNFDKRPMGFRLWNVADENGLRHQFVPLKGMPEVPAEE